MSPFRPVLLAASVAALFALASAPAAAERAAPQPAAAAPAAASSSASPSPAAPREARGVHAAAPPPKVDPPQPPAPNPLFLRCAGCDGAGARAEVRLVERADAPVEDYAAYTLRNAHITSKPAGDPAAQSEVFRFDYGTPDPAARLAPYRGVIHDRAGRPAIEVTGSVDRYGILRNVQYKLIGPAEGATSGPDAPPVTPELFRSFEHAATAARGRLPGAHGGIHVAGADLNGDGEVPLVVAAAPWVASAFDPARPFDPTRWARVTAPSAGSAMILPRIDTGDEAPVAWIDPGAEVATAQDGRKYKMLFAPLVTDLENRLVLGSGATAGPRPGPASTMYLMLPYIEQEPLFRHSTPGASGAGASLGTATAPAERVPGVHAWLVHRDRERVSAVELLQLAGYRDGLVAATYRAYLERPVAPAGWEVFGRPGAPGVESFGTAKRPDAETGTVAALPSLSAPRGVDAHRLPGLQGVVSVPQTARGPAPSPQANLLGNLGAAVLGPELLRSAQPLPPAPLHR